MVDVKFLTSFDRCRLASGGTEAFDFIGADTIQSIYTEYALICGHREGPSRTTSYAKAMQE